MNAGLSLIKRGKKKRNQIEIRLRFYPISYEKPGVKEGPFQWLLLHNSLNDLYNLQILLFQV